MKSNRIEKGLKKILENSFFFFSLSFFRMTVDNPVTSFLPRDCRCRRRVDDDDGGVDLIRIDSRA